jgi:hypothetical protein
MFSVDFVFSLLHNKQRHRHLKGGQASPQPSTEREFVIYLYITLLFPIFHHLLAGRQY